ncbi:hypothetical protein BT69DRAFT_1275789 [Atractiella rhizophila]|nr:hypothetical protein BT69DRAFT_1275789 [Atractiella rhizophila]
MAHSRSSSESSEQHPPVDEAAQQKWDAFYPKIVNVITALGGWEEVLIENEDGDKELVKVYKVGEEVTGCLKDLKRFFRLDDHDPDRTVLKIYYKQGLLQKDLIPILQSMHKETDGFQRSGTKREKRIALMTAELICALIWPLDVPEELKEWADLTAGAAKVDVNSQLTYHLEYKSAILNSEILGHLLALCSENLGKSRKVRAEIDESIITLFLHIIRNLAFIRDRGTGMGQNLQSTLIHQLSQHSIFDLMLTIASCSDSPEFSPWNILTMEIFWLIFRCVENPEDLWIGMDSGTSAGGSIASNKLSNLLALEDHEKRFTKRHETTRHSRFGTTLQLSVGDYKYILHKQSAITKAPGDTIDERKRMRASKTRAHNDLIASTTLKPFAVNILRSVAIQFIEHSFNVFFSSILSDIRMERAKVKQMDAVRLMFLTRFFLEFFRRLKSSRSASCGWDLIGDMLDPSSFAFVVARMKMAHEEKPILWTELHAGVDCFIQMLLAIEELSQSANEDDKDLSDILQNKLYYEGETLDMILKLMGTYKDQSVQYLNSVVQLAFVLLRMLEKYSKSKAHMYIRKKTIRRNKKKAKKSADEKIEAELPLAMEEEDGEIETGENSYREHAFTFEVFEAKFATESILKTLIVFLQRYQEFVSTDQMKWVVNLLHRQAIKAQMETIFFRVSVLETFHMILENQRRLPKTQPYQDLIKLIHFVLKKFFRTVETNPFAVAEAFFPRRVVGGIAKPGEDSESDLEKEHSKKPMRLPAELVIEEELPMSQKIAIAVGCLAEKNEEYLLEWVKNQLAFAAGFRTQIMLTAGEEPDSLSEGTANKFEDYVVRFDTVDAQRAATKNSHLKMLLRLLGWTSDEDRKNKALIWTIPNNRRPNDLAVDINLLDEYLVNPWNMDGKAPTDFVRKVKRKRAPKKQLQDDNSHELQDVSEADQATSVDGELKIRKPRTGKRKTKNALATQADNDERPSRTRKRQQEAKKFKSAQFINSDDDNWSEGEDAAFFERERKQRLQMTEQNAKGVLNPASKDTKSRRAPKRRRRQEHGEGDPLPSTDLEVEREMPPPTPLNDAENGSDVETFQPVKKRIKKIVIESDREDD